MNIKLVLKVIVLLLFFTNCSNSTNKTSENKPDKKVQSESEVSKFSENSDDLKDTVLKTEFKSKVIESTPIKREFQDCKMLSEYPNTEFILTLENNISNSKNAIYTSSFLFAWDEIKKQINSKIELDSNNSSDLIKLNNSRSHKGSLKKGDYKSEITVENDVIKAKVSFNKSLPFKTKFESIKSGVKFSSDKVKAFRISYFNQNLEQNIKILYYKDDNHFVIKLLPKDENHEIILAKGIKLSGNFNDLLRETNKWINEGEKEIKNGTDSWKFKFSIKDEVIIPILKFNIETNFKSLESQNFLSNKIIYSIEKANLITAFILDEYGAEIKSDAKMDVAKSITKEKKMIFNKPFFVYFKRTDCKYPYFAMQVVNSELMIKK